MEDKKQINIRIFGESGSGKTHFYSGLLETFCFSHGVFNDNRSNLYSLDIQGDLLEDRIGNAKEIWEQYRGRILNTSGADTQSIVFKLIGEDEYQWPVNFFDYKGGNVVISSANDINIQAQELKCITDGDVLYILVDAVALAKCIHECEKRNEPEDNLDNLLSKSENITFIRNEMEMDKYVLILQNLLTNMKQNHLTIAFLLTKTDSKEFAGDSIEYAQNQYSDLRKVVEKMYEKEIFAIRRHEKWNCGIFPVGVFGKKNVTDDEKALNEKNLHPEGIDRVFLYSLYYAFDGIERDNSEKIRNDMSQIEGIKFADCNSFLSALKIDPKLAGSWKELKNVYWENINKRDELRAQCNELKDIMRSIKDDFGEKYDEFVFLSTTHLPKEGKDVTPKKRMVE